MFGSRLIGLFCQEFHRISQPWDQIGKGGVVKDPVLHQEAVDKINHFATTSAGLESLDVIPSPIKGATGNTEFLAWYRA